MNLLPTFRLPAALLQGVAGLGLAFLAVFACGQARAAAPVPVLQVQDAIGPASASYMLRGIRQAEASGAPLLVIRLDTPGGLDTSMRQVIQGILAARVPVAVYVSPEGARAASAGTFLLYAAHIAAMAPATTLGAATPVAIGMPGGDAGKPPRDATREGREADGARKAEAPGGDAMTAKRVHDAAAYIRGLAQQRGRNAEWAERAVREAVSLTASEALREHVVDIVATDLQDLLVQIDGRRVRLASGEVTLATRGATTEVLLPDWRQRILSVIANPSFALILLMVGFYGLLFEFASPGFGVPGTVGAICLLLGLFAMQLLPVNYAGLGLIVLGLALLVAEVLTPAFGVLGLGGVAALLAGFLLVFDREAAPGFAPPLWLLLGITAASAGVVLLGGSMALRARRRPVVTGSEQLQGATGVVHAVGAEGTWAHVHGESWRVDSDVPLRPGQSVRVLGRRGLTLRVQPMDDVRPGVPRDPPSPGDPSCS